MEGNDEHRIVILDTDPDRRNYLRVMVSELGYVPFSFEKETICLDNLAALEPDLIVSGPMLPHRGFRFINSLRMRNGNMPFVLISGDRLFRDFVKIHEHDGVLLIDPAFGPAEFKDLLKQVLQERVGGATKASRPLLVGTSAAIVQIKKLIVALNGFDEPVLLWGECGTGKDLVAQVIHSRCSRSENAFVKVDLAGLTSEGGQPSPETREHRPLSDFAEKPESWFNAAHTGSLFLDEIGAIPLGLQIELLRLLKDQNYVPPVTDVRIITATRRSLDPLVDDGLFRKDLYYRLSGFTIEIPPLRERVDDIPLLTDYFADKFSMELGRNHFEISDQTKELFCAYCWPGNVRELENLVREIVCTGSEQRAADKLRAQERNPYRLEESVFPLNGPAGIRKYLQESDDLSLKTVCRTFMERAEKRIVKRALEMNDWNRKKASALLGISYRCLLSKMKEYELVASDQD